MRSFRIVLLVVVLALSLLVSGMAFAQRYSGSGGHGGGGHRGDYHGVEAIEVTITEVEAIMVTTTGAE